MTNRMITSSEVNNYILLTLCVCPFPLFIATNSERLTKYHQPDELLDEHEICEI